MCRCIFADDMALMTDNTERQQERVDSGREEFVWMQLIRIIIIIIITLFRH